MTRTELPELPAYAFERAAERDGAGAHYARVAAAWASGDPEIKARARAAEQSLNTHMAR